MWTHPGSTFHQRSTVGPHGYHGHREPRPLRTRVSPWPSSHPPPPLPVLLIPRVPSSPSHPLPPVLLLPCCPPSPPSCSCRDNRRTCPWGSGELHISILLSSVCKPGVQGGLPSVSSGLEGMRAGTPLPLPGLRAARPAWLLKWSESRQHGASAELYGPAGRGSCVGLHDTVRHQLPCRPEHGG